MVERRLVGPYGQRPTPTDGARPSKSVASSHESRAGNARDRKGRRGRKGGMGDGKKRKQRKRLARRIPLSHCKHCNHCNHCSNCRSSSSNSALAMTHTASTGTVDNETFHDIGHRNVDFMDGVDEFVDLAQDVFNSW